MLTVDSQKINASLLKKIRFYLEKDELNQLLVFLSSPQNYNEGHWLLGIVASLTEPDLPDNLRKAKLFLLKRIISICELLIANKQEFNFITAFRSIEESDLSPAIQNIKDYLFGTISLIRSIDVAEYDFSNEETNQLNILIFSSL
ncbi:MAG: hypothetical protein DWQ44_09695 [Bacteroidetes bacterium]|nr:MAG: hypothetical protein DWQ33_09970 [Bacteroidota bacterium]REK06556.1 MAG: hypothetical protein DWQ39_03485 [Bacteroidota bacterium]REK33322.1 MAG: hypothetical protein DWQ44_09695 [Bacteroidota bacterium]REK49722.1 MAG: hypothetical protein DWQ48_06250 [Bacteroidota bacterium]